MYRYSNGQISLSDFKQPVGMNLKESNRWVKKAQTIPWPDIERRYARLFTNRKGNVAKPLRLALGACIIQAEYGYSDEETALQIQENPYLQYFCGYPGYDEDKIYRNRENLSYCKLHGIRLSGPALGRPKKDEQRDRRQTYLDQNERIEVERQFSLAKRKCNLGKVKTKLEETVGFTLAMSIVVLNLRKIQRTLSRLLLQILRYLWSQQKPAFIQ